MDDKERQDAEVQALDSWITRLPKIDKTIRRPDRCKMTGYLREEERYWRSTF